MLDNAGAVVHLQPHLPGLFAGHTGAYCQRLRHDETLALRPEYDRAQKATIGAISKHRLIIPAAY